MNKVITINLGGTAFQLEEAGYEALRTYLDSAAARLQGNPDRDEIISDIEGAIAEKFRRLLASYKNVVAAKEVSDVIGEMGPIEVDQTETAGANTGAGTGGPKGPGPGSGKTPDPTAQPEGAPRRLYRIHEGAMLAGVCNGIAAYLNLDPTIVRIGFVFLTMVWGAGAIVYLVMAIVVPEARSPEEKSAASGIPSTAQEFIRRAKEGYYEATKGAMKGFPDRKARREWHRQFKREMRANAFQWRQNWHNYWAERAAAHPGMVLTLPILSVLHGMATLVWICALVSLLATGALFGMALPANVPVWVAALLLCIAYGIFAGPLKIARHFSYWSVGRPRWIYSFVFLLDAMVWLVVVAVLVWLAIHYSPELRNAIHCIPATIHHAADDIRNWWKGN